MNFFYDLNKKLNNIGTVPESTQLNERDEGKHNNATTGFAALAKKAGKEYGSKAAGERVAGAVHAKMARAGKLEEMHCSTCNCSPCSCNEGNAFSGAVVKAKSDGIQPGEKVTVGGKTYPVKEQGMSEAKGKKPDFLDLDKDGNKNEPMKKAAADKKKTVKEEDGERKTTYGTERTKGNITTHTRNYEPDVEDDDDSNAEPRKAGRPKGTKHATGAKGPTGKSKLQNLKAIREEGDTCPHCGSKKIVDERSVSQAQARTMAGAAHNPKFAKKVGVKQSVAREFNKADTGKDIGKLPKKVKEADAAPAAEKAPSNKYGFGKGIYESLNRQVDNLITEGMSVTVNMTTDDTGQPHKDITVHADGDDAAKLAELLNLAGIHQSEQSCSGCGQSPCGCGGQMVDENSPANAPDTVFASVDQVVGPQYGGGPNAPHQMINPADPAFNPPGDMGQSTVNAGPGARRVPGTTNEGTQADLGMSLYKELQQFKGK